mmetsp:Transcript_16655/g.37373  ORF Transcript_16655/g.37373 Transcript_16655/m.37373 type:complete len:83 (+) Transcript_16655:945-1193(+)
MPKAHSELMRTFGSAVVARMCDWRLLPETQPYGLPSKSWLAYKAAHNLQTMGQLCALLPHAAASYCSSYFEGTTTAIAAAVE